MRSVGNHGFFIGRSRSARLGRLDGRAGDFAPRARNEADRPLSAIAAEGLGEMRANQGHVGVLFEEEELGPGHQGLRRNA